MVTAGGSARGCGGPRGNKPGSAARDSAGLLADLRGAVAAGYVPGVCPPERLTRDGPALTCTGDSSVRGPVRAARRVRVDAAGISAQGLVGFARSNMALRGPWPYLLFFALDGAAGVCAVLLVRRAARAEPGLAPRLAVWGLVAASSFFNWTHAPRRPAAPEAFGLMPVIAALLFEFCLREMRLRTANRADRTLNALRWLRPAERIRVQLCMAADQRVSAEEATSRVRIDAAARRLYHLRALLRAHEQAASPGMLTARRIRRAERRAYGALIRAGFTEPLIAFAVLRQVQVMTQTATLARLDYGTADAAHAAIASLISSTPAAAPGPDPAHPAARDAPPLRSPWRTARCSQPQRTPARRRHAGPCRHGSAANRKRASRRTTRIPATVMPSSSQPPGASSPTPARRHAPEPDRARREAAQRRLQRREQPAPLAGSRQRPGGRPGRRAGRAS